MIDKFVGGPGASRNLTLISPGQAPIHVALVGDRNLEVPAHAAIPLALSLAAAALGVEVDPVWVPTAELEAQGLERLGNPDAIWCVPGSPYASMTGALGAIRHAREHGRPFLGTCGGFQHALIEHARNVLGRPEADHEESSPNAPLALISALACSLAGAAGAVHFLQGSKIAAAYGCTSAIEEYNCRFGLNPAFRWFVEQGPLSISGVDEHGEARAIELNDHPFFLATLFQPERAALAGKLHPLVTAFLRAALQARAHST